MEKNLIEEMFFKKNKFTIKQEKKIHIKEEQQTSKVHQLNLFMKICALTYLLTTVGYDFREGEMLKSQNRKLMGALILPKQRKIH